MYNDDDYELKTPNNTLPWVEKYRPSTLDEILSHENIINTIKTFIKNRCLPHLLFYGPPGSGKTSTITAAAKELYGKYFPFMVMELNASDDRGIEVVRNKIKQFVMSKNVLFGETVEDRQNIFKLVILDETDAMTRDAQAILRKIVEQYTESARFCLICNYIQNINEALRSRCTKFRFSPIDKDQVKIKINEVASKENIKITESGIETIIKRSNGDMRKALNMLQSVSMTYSIVNEKTINTCIGYPRKQHMDTIMENLINKKFNVAYNNINILKNTNGLSLGDIINELHDILTEYITNDTSNYPYKNQLTINNIVTILDKLRTIEYNHSVNTIENIQLSGLISIFKSNINQ
ncbi:replication factor C small subunit [Fadolivirus algeromassiliense]|jgi:replication factor C subunit 3/5|uniref:Replication factor C small subunit n=1 Tax=Fadolivirus FV1/VV64 TaxID=3070911 RepID=A0A7D3V5M3_9VIRU|nr:replication factor C small subunit [Fadolivirus algeromassiliense]QKF94032.1 replication factor C small subunit [Fadolivirus FV1/VV64]